jgi:hypothetical protein
MPSLIPDTDSSAWEEWWHALDDAIGEGTAPEELQTLASEEVAQVEPERLDEVLEFAAGLPGWGKPNARRHPFTVL